jgi:uncharacterized membrane protein
MQDPPLWQRLVAALAYLLPWSDGIGFGTSLFREFPALLWLALPAAPLQFLQNAVPLGSLVLFLVLFLAVARNPQVPYFVRFAVFQALLIDIVLVLLQLAFQTLFPSLADTFLVRTLANAVFLGTLLVVLYGIVEAARGREAEIPTVSEAVRMQRF